MKSDGMRFAFWLLLSLGGVVSVILTLAVRSSSQELMRENMSAVVGFAISIFSPCAFLLALGLGVPVGLFGSAGVSLLGVVFSVISLVGEKTRPGRGYAKAGLLIPIALWIVFGAFMLYIVTLFARAPPFCSTLPASEIVNQFGRHALSVLR